MIVRIFQGPGNQMFQLAYGLAASMRMNTSLKLDLSWFRKNSGHRAYILDHFKHDLPIATDEDIRRAKVCYAETRVRLTANQLCNWVAPRHKKSVVVERLDDYDSPLLYPNPKAYITGYFTSESFFQSHENLVRSTLTYTKPLSNLSKAVQNDMRKGGAVALSVRRGDFVNNPLHDVCGLDYFERAISWMENRFENLHFYVFSDDLPWVSENLKLPRNKTIMDFNSPNYMEDLFLMTQCSHHIIPNSTFSWWGAWLANDPNQTVIAPKRWLGGSNVYYDHVVPNRWVQLEN